MKKILNIAICLLAVFFLTVPMAMGEGNVTNSVETDGNVRATFTVGGVPTTTQPLLFDASPNVSLSCYIDDMAFALTTTNILTNTTNGYEYGTLSTASGYMQAQKVVEPGEAVSQCTAVDALPIDGSWVGGESTGS